MSLTVSASAGRWWSDMIADEETTSLRMTPMEWRNEMNRMLRSARQGKVVEVLASIAAKDAERATAFAPQTIVMPTPMSAEDLEMRVWQDMVEEPWKYGDDIAEWLELNEKLSVGSKRWRVDAFWLQKEQEVVDVEEDAQAPWRAIYSQVAQDAAIAGERAWFRRDVKRIITNYRKSVVVVQSAVRGYLARRQMKHLDCCMCLKHGICSVKTDVGTICDECVEQGPYEDITGPLADPWNWSRDVKRCQSCEEALECDAEYDFCSIRCNEEFQGI